jgi:uncharacterized membrane protein
MTRLLRLAFQRETARPMLALLFASAVCLGLVFARIAWTGNIFYGFLIWNLFLAWVPLGFALLACEKYQQAPRPSWPFLALVAGWLLFFPNAPYIFTDLIHLTGRFSHHFWVDLVLILGVALTGLVVGFVSLYLMQTVVTRMLGRAMSWLFIGVVTALSGFGIYIGRFLRLNSWDVVVRPLAVSRGLGQWVTDPLAHPASFAFPILFATFLFIAYVLFYGLTHLQPAPDPMSAPASASGSGST